MKDTFVALSADVLRNNSESFLQIARASLDQARQGATADLSERQKEITALVEPVKQTLDRLDAHLHESDKGQATLRGQLMAVNETQALLRLQTQALVNALKSPNQRGRWGELTLRNVLERSGMRQYCDFIEKDYATTEEGRSVIECACCPKTSSHRRKVPSTLSQVGETDTRRGCARSFRQVGARQGVGGKKLLGSFSRSEFVVIFVPARPLFYAAMQNDPACSARPSTNAHPPAGPRRASPHDQVRLAAAAPRTTPRSGLGRAMRRLAIWRNMSPTSRT